MSYKSELQSNNTDLQSILNTVNALPDANSGGSGGGGAVETCTVTIEKTTTRGTVNGISATTVEDGTAAGRVYGFVVSGTTPLIPSGQTGSVTLEVVCGSVIALYCIGSIIDYTPTDNVFTFLSASNPRSAWIAPTTAGDVGTISFADND